MFQINYRIVDDFEELKSMETAYFDYECKHIYGFFQICFGEQKEGCYYHENPLGEGEIGGELLDYWFVKLLDVISLLDAKTSYVAFREIETDKKWLEFKRLDKNIVINVALASTNVLTQLLVSKPIDEFSYVAPINYTLTLLELKRSVIDETKTFLNELNDLNPKLLNTKMALELKNKLENAEKYVDY